ncbi:hypothetical protein ACH41H_48095 [Streptomyces sp. NPDC020800]|uniref:hypothetical protein n=1 Tax=Streptomyces sp. NPDC020800 TaxID=3365092 RepID=UPI00378F82C0
MFRIPRRPLSSSLPSSTQGPWWLVTVPFYGPQGRTGHQTFAISGHNVDAIVARAEARAHLPEARRRRGGATADFSTPVVERWKATSFAL